METESNPKQLTRFLTAFAVMTAIFVACMGLIFFVVGILSRH